MAKSAFRFLLDSAESCSRPLPSPRKTAPNSVHGCTPRFRFSFPSAYYQKHFALNSVLSPSSSPLSRQQKELNSLLGLHPSLPYNPQHVITTTASTATDGKRNCCSASTYGRCCARATRSSAACSRTDPAVPHDHSNEKNRTGR